MSRFALCLALSLSLGAGAALGAPPTPEQKAFEDQLKGAAAMSPAKGYNFSDGAIDGKLGSGKMRRANRAAAEIVQQRMARDRASDLKLIRQAAAADVVILAGSYDRVQDVLKAMALNYVVVPPALLDEIELLATQTVMVNCPGQLSEVAIGKIRSFVERGGYLVTTDWALKYVVEKAFPKTIRFNGRPTPDDVVGVHVHTPDEPLLAHVKVMGDDPRWWLESGSYPIQILDRRRVKVLMSSKDMEKKYGDAPVVVSFRHEDGKVLHMTSHFYLQRSQLIARGDKGKGSEFAKEAGLSKADVAALKNKGVDVDSVAAGDLNSAYAMQQLTTNLVVAKQKENKALIAKKYRGEVIEDVRPAKAAGKAASEKTPEMKKGFRVKVLRERDGYVEVEDLFGRRGWVPSTVVR